MPTGFYLDIYTLTDNRNRETIEKFLLEYTNRQSIEQTEDCELAILKKGKLKSEGIKNDDYIFVKSETLTNSINIGLSDPTNCFTLYLNSKKTEIKYLVLSFTQDGKLILGIAINEYIDEDERIDNYELAKKIAEDLENNNSGKGNYFGVEIVPALNEKDFFEDIELYKNYR